MDRSNTVLEFFERLRAKKKKRECDELASFDISQSGATTSTCINRDVRKSDKVMNWIKNVARPPQQQVSQSSGSAKFSFKPSQQCSPLLASPEIETKSKESSAKQNLFKHDDFFNDLDLNDKLVIDQDENDPFYHYEQKEIENKENVDINDGCAEETPHKTELIGSQDMLYPFYAKESEYKIKSIKDKNDPIDDDVLEDDDFFKELNQPNDPPIENIPVLNYQNQLYGDIKARNHDSKSVPIENLSVSLSEKQKIDINEQPQKKPDKKSGKKKASKKELIVSENESSINKSVVSKSSRLFSLKPNTNSFNELPKTRSMPDSPSIAKLTQNHDSKSVPIENLSISLSEKQEIDINEQPQKKPAKKAGKKKALKKELSVSENESNFNKSVVSKSSRLSSLKPSKNSSKKLLKTRSMPDSPSITNLNESKSYKKNTIIQSDSEIDESKKQVLEDTVEPARSNEKIPSKDKITYTKQKCTFKKVTDAIENKKKDDDIAVQYWELHKMLHGTAGVPEAYLNTKDCQMDSTIKTRKRAQNSSGNQLMLSNSEPMQGKRKKAKSYTANTPDGKVNKSKAEKNKSKKSHKSVDDMDVSKVVKVKSSEVLNNASLETGLLNSKEQVVEWFKTSTRTVKRTLTDYQLSMLME